MPSVTQRYSPRLKTRNDLVSEITPLVWKSTPDDRPYGPFVPAPWLPVEWQDDVSKDWFVMSSGKAVASTRGRGEPSYLVPAGLRNRWGASTGITYTSNDFDNYTQDITTGEDYAVDGTTTYTPTQIRDALRSRGLIGASAAATDYISYPVGCILYNVYAWAGGDGLNPAHLKFQNYQLQKGVQYSTRSQMIAPIVPTVHAAVSVPGSLTGSALAFGSGNAFSAANTVSKARYDQITNTDFISLALADYPMATDTDRTPVTGSSTDVLVREVKADWALYATAQEAIAYAVDRLTTAGDYFIDYESGVIFFYVAGGASIGANLSGETVTYYSYAAAPSTVERYFAIVGDVRAGDWLKTDENSNLAFWDPASDNDFERIARIHSFVTQPLDLLDRVQTSWSGSDFGTKQQMTGTASKGFSSQVTYSNAADKLANIVLNVR